MTHAALAGLLAMQHAPIEAEDELALYLGSDFDETLREVRSDRLRGDLPRARLEELVLERAFGLLDLESLARCATCIASLLAPLALASDEVDLAIVEIGRWLVRLTEDDTFARIVELKRQADEAGLDEGPTDSSPEAIAAWNELFDAFCEQCDAGQIQFELGGRDVLITLEADATLVIVEREPGGGDFEQLVVFIHSMGGDDGDGNDDDPEPEPEPDPSRPELLDA